MPDALKALIDAGYIDGTNAFSYNQQAGNDFITCAVAIGDQNWADAETFMKKAAGEIGTFGKYLLQDDVFYKGLRRDWRDALYWINDNWPTTGEIDMDMIINAMLKATFSQLQYFIGIVDAYRVALWNAPFNVDFYAALARGFQKWP